MLDLTWLSATVDLPLWAVLSLAGYHRVLQRVTEAGRRRRDRARSSTSDD